MDKNENEVVEIDFFELFGVIKSRLWIIILTGLILAFVAGLYSYYMITPIYSSKTQLYIINKSTNTTSLADFQIGSQLTQDYMILVKSRLVVNQVIKNIDLDMTYEELVNTIELSNPSNGRVLVIKVNHPDPYLAKRIADEFAHVSTEQIAISMETKPTIIDEGNLPTAPSSPNMKMNVLIGGGLGGLISTGIIVLLYVMDDTIKSSDDVEKYLNLSTLGFIPLENGRLVKTTARKKKRMDKRKMRNER